ncbi:hypothetical protein AB6A40_004053 [Gnathostoma spinigerum]|uniref:Uncharacterized protein n=1 Tax=Gnathostoma spinigerum TaxID=75299 RepID=A0ABD6EJ21_9BILA
MMDSDPICGFAFIYRRRRYRMTYASPCSETYARGGNPSIHSVLLVDHRSYRSEFMVSIEVSISTSELRIRDSDASLLVVFSSFDDADEEFTFLLEKIIQNATTNEKIWWFRNHRPSKISSSFRAPLCYLKHINLHYGKRKLLDIVCDLCAEIHTIPNSFETLIVEFDDYKFSHESDFATMLALLKDASHFLKKRRSCALNNFPVTVVASFNETHQLISTLYADHSICIPANDCVSAFTAD